MTTLCGRQLCRRQRSVLTAVVLAAGLASVPLRGQQPPDAQGPSAQAPPAPVTDASKTQDQPAQPNIVYRSNVDVVSVAAVVRDRRNHVVSTLTRDQFKVLDAGESREILDLQADSSSPASVGILIDGSGSMRLGSASMLSHRIAESVLRSLDARRDQASLMTFDRRLVTLEDFTHDFGRVHDALGRVEAFGMTSLYDAIGGASGLIADRARSRRALVVLTDGFDTGSRYSPDQVATIASSIDVPVYVFALAPDPVAPDAVVRASTLRALAQTTGGDLIVADTQGEVDAGIRKLVEELRHQYLISFNAGRFDGLRRLEIRTVRNDLKVRSRLWYLADND